MSGHSVFKSINPYTGECFSETAAMDPATVDHALGEAAKAAPAWRAKGFAERAELLLRTADHLEENRARLARVMTEEMGKLSREAVAEIEKCAWVCRYYAENAERFLADERVDTDARESLICYQPLGPVLAVMPWNFPFWQVFRFAAPALMAGNVGLLKHASNVSLCAKAIEAVFREAGVPEGVFTTLLIGAEQVEGVITDSRIKATTLTGSEPAGRAVASTAASVLKKSVLELGGSDPFIVLEDADLAHTVEKAVASRYMNAGQSCIAAKRFILVEAVAERFIEAFTERVRALRMGDPCEEATSLAPMARADLRAELHAQVRDALDKGAVAVTGCEPEPDTHAFYRPSILDRVTPAMRAWKEELFGPVAIVIRARDEEEALRIANDSDFGLGGSVWTEDRERGEALARRLECGCAFVNELVKSDPRLPFGGIKHSGFGRELGWHGIHEFVNAKTLWVD